MDTPSGHTLETAWFRDPHVFLALEQKLLPDYIGSLATRERHHLRILSVGCATGQEAYSVALLVEELIEAAAPETQKKLAGKIEIVGVDKVANALKIAERGLYNDLAMARGLSTDLQESAFSEVGTIWQIRPLHKSRLRFEVQDIHKDFSALGQFDIILLCNVVDAFTPLERANLYPRLRESLTEGGCLLLDKPEMMLESIVASTWFQTLRFGNCHYYQRTSLKETPHDWP